MKYKFAIIFLAVFSLLSLHTMNVSAATISASAESAVSSGDTSIIDVFLNTEGAVINSIDGSISLSDEHNGNFEIQDISLVNSVFTLWPRKPSLESNGKISFIGGVPGGVAGDRLLIFKLVVKINASGKFSVNPNSLSAYVNDGLGTAINITKDASIIVVAPSNGESKDKWKEVISNDNVAPEPFTISLVEDPNLFDGRKFISFETTDSQSGISYYEVRERGYEAVRSGTTYVLIEQNKSVDVVVTAYDKAGNFQISTMGGSQPINWLSILVTLLIIGVVYKLINLVRRKRSIKNAQ
ncbi:MAG: hypothetical protein KBC06_02190 [Candidatus Pacebacteria bacterium]|nr:hypothetical protein [Candidatus Paceibacterota bacterium]